MNNLFLKIIFSLPIVLLMLYLFPVVGVIFAMIHLYLYRRARDYFPILLLIIGIILYLPRILEILSQKFQFTIISLSEILEMPIYSQIQPYAKRLIILGIVFMLVSAIFKWIVNLGRNSLLEYIKGQEMESAKLNAKNDLIMKEKREKSLNSHVILCPHCGADNLIYGDSGTCKFCRKMITVKEKN